MGRRLSIGRVDISSNSPPSFSISLTNENKNLNLNSKIYNFLFNFIKTINKSIRKLWYEYSIICLKYTWLNSLILFLIPILIFQITNTRQDQEQEGNNPLEQFIFLSYKLQVNDEEKYGKGIEDLYFVFYYSIFFTFFREFIMQVISKPLALKNGLKNPKKIKRFMEQSYLIIYCGLSSAFGLYIMFKTPNLWFFKTKTIYENYPLKFQDFNLKLYYLLQSSFWLQQSFVMFLKLEKPRKDQNQMIFHHFLTLLLIFLSYKFHFTMIGLEVFISMDIADFFLSLSKCLNYIDSKFTNIIFCFFIIIWIYLRHFINGKILWSILTEFKEIGVYELNWEREEYKCWISQIITFSLLFGLFSINCLWLFLIIRIAARIAISGQRKDDRSDEESENEKQECEEGIKSE